MDFRLPAASLDRHKRLDLGLLKLLPAQAPPVLPEDRDDVIRRDVDNVRLDEDPALRRPRVLRRAL